jgi:hypothetical protein
MINTKLAIMQYLNKSDRGYYFTVFNSPAYAQYDDAKLSILAKR